MGKNGSASAYNHTISEHHYQWAKHDFQRENEMFLYKELQITVKLHDNGGMP